MEKDINNLQICMTGMKKDIEFIKDSLMDNKNEHKEILSKIEHWIEASEKRFAHMWTAKAIKFVLKIILAGVVTAVLSLVIK